MGDGRSPRAPPSTPPPPPPHPLPHAQVGPPAGLLRTLPRDKWSAKLVAQEVRGVCAGGCVGGRVEVRAECLPAHPPNSTPRPPTPPQVLADRSTARVTSGQRVSLNTVEAVSEEQRAGGTFWLYEHVSQVGVGWGVAVRACAAGLGRCACV